MAKASSTHYSWKSKPFIASNVGAIPLKIRDGDTCYFYQTPQKTAQRVSHLLRNPKAAHMIGDRGKQYVTEHFLLPDRVADYLMAMTMLMNRDGSGKVPADCLISFHPWFKMAKRTREKACSG